MNENKIQIFCSIATAAGCCLIGLVWFTLASFGLEIMNDVVERPLNGEGEDGGGKPEIEKGYQSHPL